MRFCCVNLSSSDMTDVPNSTQFDPIRQSSFACSVQERQRVLSILGFHMIILRNQFSKLLLSSVADLFRKFLSWERFDRSSPYFNHQFENDALWLLPTLGQSDKIEISHNYGSVSPLTIFDSIISNAVLLPDSQSVDRTKTTMRLQMSPLSRQ